MYSLKTLHEYNNKRIYIYSRRADSCVKIGEGISGEVFKVQRSKQSKFGHGVSALKVFYNIDMLEILQYI